MFHDRLRYRRKELGLSREYVAKRLGVSPPTISNYENGVTTPKISDLTKLFSILDCDANYLYIDEMKSLNQLYLYQDEIEIIKIYRDLDQTEKEILLKFCHSLKK